MILGVSQASILTNLLIQLNSLTSYTNKLTNLKRTMSYQQKLDFEINAMKSLNRKVKIVNLVSISVSVLLVCAFIYQIFSWHAYFDKNSATMCGTSSSLKQTSEFRQSMAKLLEPYTILRIMALSLILIWLSVVTFFTLMLLKKGQQRVYSSEIKRVQIVYLSFIVTYIC